MLPTKIKLCVTRRPWLPVLLVAVLLAGCAAKGPPQVRGPEYFFDKGKTALDKHRYLEAVENFQRLVSNFPGSSRIADAQYFLAESYFGMEDYVNAVFEYQRLLDTYPSSGWADEAEFKIGESYFEQRRRAELDQAETYEALAAFRRFMEDNPGSPLIETAQQRIDQCRSRLAHKAFLGAQLYHRQDHFEAARMSYDQLLLDYPLTAWYWQGLAHLGELERLEGGIEAARLHWQQVIDGCSDPKLIKQVEKWLAETSAERLSE